MGSTTMQQPIVDQMEIAGASWAAVTATDGEDGPGFTLSWHDGVANSWTFEDPLLSVVLMRLATLVACGEVDFTAFFTTDDSEFAGAARKFLADQTSAPDRTWHGGPAKPRVEFIGGDDPGAQWRLWIPPTSIWCFEGATLDGAIIGVWGNTYWPTHSEACEFLGQTMLGASL